MRSIDVFRTRSYQEEPVGTLIRSAEWVMRGWLGSTTSFDVFFGAHRFKLALQSARRGFGSAGIFIQRRYYEPLLEFGDKLLNGDDCAIDGGANQGIFTCAFAAAVGNKGRVFAFEPNPNAVNCIKTNATLNGFGNITVFDGALSNELGETYLMLGSEPVGGYISSRPEGTDYIKVNTYSIDNLFDAGELPEIQFMKLDIEGSELSALRGAQFMLQRARPRICIEALDGELYRKINNILITFGYKAYKFDDRGNLNNFSSFYPCPNVFFII
jgi:FkbM family methyltransferase